MTSFVIVMFVSLWLVILPIVKTTDETSKWIIKCGTSQKECDRRTHYCETRVDKCSSCFEYCSERRIQGNQDYQKQCHEHCPVWMRDQEKRALQTKLTTVLTNIVPTTLPSLGLWEKLQGERQSPTDPNVIQATERWSSDKTVTVAATCLVVLPFGILAVLAIKKYRKNPGVIEKDIENGTLISNNITNDTVTVGGNTAGMEQENDEPRENGHHVDDISTNLLGVSDNGADIRVAKSDTLSAIGSDDQQHDEMPEINLQQSSNV